MRSPRLLFSILGLSILVTTRAAVAGQAAPAAPASAPFALHVTCTGRGDAARLRVQIANTAGRDTAIVLGFDAPGGQAHVVDSVDVFAIRAATGADEDYVYVNPKYALATGAPWIVSVPAGKSYDLDLPVTDFISRLNYSNLDVSVAAGSRLVFEARPAGKSTTRVWTGKVETRIDSCN